MFKRIPFHNAKAVGRNTVVKNTHAEVGKYTVLKNTLADCAEVELPIGRKYSC